MLQSPWIFTKQWSSSTFELWSHRCKTKCVSGSARAIGSTPWNQGTQNVSNWTRCEEVWLSYFFVFNKLNAWSTLTRSRPICMAIMIVYMERGTLYGTRWLILSWRQKNCWLLKKSCLLVVFSLRPSCTQAFPCLWINDFDCMYFHEWFCLLSKNPTRDPTITWHSSPCYPTQALSDDVQTLSEFFRQSSEPFTWFPHVISRI